MLAIGWSPVQVRAGFEIQPVQSHRGGPFFVTGSSRPQLQAASTIEAVWPFRACSPLQGRPAAATQERTTSPPDGANFACRRRQLAVETLTASPEAPEEPWHAKWRGEVILFCRNDPSHRPRRMCFCFSGFAKSFASRCVLIVSSGCSSYVFCFPAPVPPVRRSGGVRNKQDP